MSPCMTANAVHSAYGKLSILTSDLETLDPGSIRHLRPFFSLCQLFPLWTFPFLVPPPAVGCRSSFLKNSLPFSGRVRIFLQSNNSAGGWSGVTNDTLAPVWQKAPNLGFSYREMYASPQQPIFFKDLFIHSGDLDGSRHWPFLGAGLCSWGSVHRTAWSLNRDLVNPHSIPVRKCSRHPHFTVEQMEEQRGDITWRKSPSWYVARWGFELRLPGSSF